MNPKSVLVAALLTFPLSVASSAGRGDILGQKIVDQEMAKHPELALLSLHTIPPQASQSEIIASTKREKVGKKSDPDDLFVVKTGKPEIKDMPKRQIFDLLFPLRDEKGKIIGTVVMEVNYSAEMTRKGALKTGGLVAKEIRQQVPSKEQLFERN
jgi:hypothetical protein